MEFRYKAREKLGNFYVLPHFFHVILFYFLLIIHFFTMETHLLIYHKKNYKASIKLRTF